MDRFEADWLELYVDYVNTKQEITEYRTKANMFIARKLAPNIGKDKLQYFEDMTFQDADLKLIEMRYCDSSEVTEEEFWKIERQNQRAIEIEKKASALKVTTLV